MTNAEQEEKHWELHRAAQQVRFQLLAKLDYIERLVLHTQECPSYLRQEILNVISGKKPLIGPVESLYPSAGLTLQDPLNLSSKP